MARPKSGRTTGVSSDGCERERPFLIAFRVTEAERDRVRERADDHGLSVADFTRGAALASKPVGVRAKRRLPSGAERALSTLSAQLLDHTAEMNKIGANVNRITAAANEAALKGANFEIAPSALGKLTAAIDRERQVLDAIRKAVLAALDIDTE